MPTVYANPGNALCMQTMNGTILSFREVPFENGFNMIHELIKQVGERETLDIVTNTSVDKTSGKTIRQIEITWKGDNEAAYEVIYEWLT